MKYNLKQSTLWLIVLACVNVVLMVVVQLGFVAYDFAYVLKSFAAGLLVVLLPHGLALLLFLRWKSTPVLSPAWMLLQIMVSSIIKVVSALLLLLIFIKWFVPLQWMVLILAMVFALLLLWLKQFQKIQNHGC